jgi:hypothetical protein
VPTKSNARKKKRFLEALSRTGNVTRAAEICSIDRTLVYDWRKADPDFKAAWDETLDVAVDLLIDEAQRRAHDGVDEPVFYMGQECGTIRRYSDSLLMFLIKGKRPEYATERRQLSGPNDGPIEVKTLSDEELDAKITALLGKTACGNGPGSDDPESTHS